MSRWAIMGSALSCVGRSQQGLGSADGACAWRSSVQHLRGAAGTWRPCRTVRTRSPGRFRAGEVARLGPTGGVSPRTRRRRWSRASPAHRTDRGSDRRPTRHNIGRRDRPATRPRRGRGRPGGCAGSAGRGSLAARRRHRHSRARSRTRTGGRRPVCRRPGHAAADRPPGSRQRASGVGVEREVHRRQRRLVAAAIDALRGEARDGLGHGGVRHVVAVDVHGQGIGDVGHVTGEPHERILRDDIGRTRLRADLRAFLGRGPEPREVSEPRVATSGGRGSPRGRVARGLERQAEWVADVGGREHELDVDAVGVLEGAHQRHQRAHQRRCGRRSRRHRGMPAERPSRACSAPRTAVVAMTAARRRPTANASA
jgi:hypothetical protein